MKIRIVSSEELNKCPQKRLDAEHYLSVKKGCACFKRKEVKYNLRTLNNLLKDKKVTEITKHKGQYYILHICKNNVPVPLFYSKDAEEIAQQIKIGGF